MRRIALVTASALALAAAAITIPVPATGASRTHVPHELRPHSGAVAALSPARPVTTPTLRAPSIASSPVTCDQGFDLVASPNGANNDYLVATAVISWNDAWAVGNTFNPAASFGGDTTLAEHWNGISWTIVPTPNPGPYRNQLAAVAAVSSNDVWAVGFYQVDTLQDFHTFAEHWNGSAWSQVLTTANPSSIFSLLLSVTAISTGDIWAVGTYDVGGTLVPMAQHWDGSHWNNLFVPNPVGDTNQLFSVSAWSSTDVWAVGSAATTLVPLPLPPIQPLAEHYDGANWSIRPAGTLTGDNEILAVTALEANHAEGVGYGNFVSGVSSSQSAGWNLTTVGPGTVTNLGSALPISGTGNNALFAVDRSGDTLWAGGYFRGTPSGPLASLAVPASWNATTHALTWHMVGVSANPSSLNNVIEAVAAVTPNVFWGVGYETNISGVDQTFATMECAVHLQVGAPLTAATGSAFSLSVTALNGGGTATNYAGTVHFTSNDPHATLPPDYTFVGGDAGTHTFAGVVLRSPYHETITATDTATPFVTASTTVSAHCPGTCQSTSPPPPPARSVTQSGSGPPGHHTRTPAQAPAWRFRSSGRAVTGPAAGSREAFPKLL